jgi:hypothetical protein
MEQGSKTAGDDPSFPPSARLGFRAKLGRAAQANPDLPRSFTAESLKSLAEPRKDSTPFVPRSRMRTSTGI